MKTRIRTAAFLLAAALTLGACGTSTTNIASGAGSPTTATAGSGSIANAAGYTPVSAVAAHAAIGKDVAAIKAEAWPAEPTDAN